MSELSPLRDTHQVRREPADTAHAAGGLHGAVARDGRALGGVYVDFLPVSDAAHPVHGQCMASVKSFGDMMVGTAKALEDNIITSEKEGNSPGSATGPWATFWPCCSRATKRRLGIGAGRKRTPPELREQRRGQTSSEDCSNG